MSMWSLEWWRVRNLGGKHARGSSSGKHFDLSRNSIRDLVEKFSARSCSVVNLSSLDSPSLGKNSSIQRRPRTVFLNAWRHLATDLPMFRRSTVQVDQLARGWR